MQTSQKHQSSAELHMLYTQPYYSAQFQVADNNVLSDSSSSQGTSNLSFQATKEQFFTLESTPVSGNLPINDSPSVSISSSRSPFSPQGSHSPDNVYGSPFSGSSSFPNDETELWNKTREIEFFLMSNDYNVADEHRFSTPGQSWSFDELLVTSPQLDLKEVLCSCARAVSDGDSFSASRFMDALEKMVSVSGEPIQRLGAYMLEGLRARLEGSGTNIYKALKCKEPTGRELMSYMGVLFKICPYWKFAYASANAVIMEAMANEPRIHIIDFQIAQGTQYMFLIQDLAKRPGGPPLLRITGLDDSQSNHARGGGLNLVGEKLLEVARRFNVPFEFHDATMSGCQVQRENLNVQSGCAVAVNFPFVLHHMPDESVSVYNHRDRLLHLVKSLSPKIVTLTEQESNTNTSPFFSRFVETLDYYTAMFESIDAACSRDDKQRISAEQHCVARDIVNMIACEDAERIERHELHGKWRLRFTMAGFNPRSLSSSVVFAVRNVLKDYSENYRLGEREGALYLGWKRRAMAVCSAWMPKPE